MQDNAAGVTGQTYDGSEAVRREGYLVANNNVEKSWKFPIYNLKKNFDDISINK